MHLPLISVQLRLPLDRILGIWEGPELVRRVSTQWERIEMIRLHEQGQCLPQIAQQMGLNRY